ncbi:hypothetical protein ACOI1C_03520 [Bacillus sp. DJP31]|uniref:hypothetical protein n=1 Tax=Bacillus sp. DJP31 TaxID=3409789 RepID=UPI003BB6935D
MKRRYSPYSLPPWLRYCRSVVAQFVFPIMVFQVIRTLIFPTVLDVLLLATLIFLVFCFKLEWI